MSVRHTGQALAALCCTAAMIGCGQAEDRGSVMLAISTDMYVNKDLDRVDIIVQPEVGPAQSTQVNLFPALEGRYLPGTFSIIEGTQAGEFVRVRLVARQADRTRVVREAALKIPRERTALLTMPIQWLCDGHVKQEGTQARSSCDEGYTCIGGTCQLDEIDEASLPTYQSAEVFGGGNATGGGTCFDTLPCFEQSSEPSLDRDTCILNTAPGDDLNVAAVLPPGGDGHCTTDHCWIPLDASPLTGWSPSESGDTVQLPRALCELVSTGGATVRASRSCPSKTPSTPTCGPWTLVGTEAGDEQLPLPPVVGTPVGLDVELASLADKLAERVARACALVAQQSPPAGPTPADLNSLCRQAGNAVAPSAPLSWFHVPARCFPDSERQLSCERACSGCQPGSMLDRCEVSSILGSCSATCESRRCLGSLASPTSCKGACDGQLVGQCQGTCLGTCVGTCSTAQQDNRCDGTCTGICTGLCAGRGEGSCAGLCDGDPNLGPSACDTGATCMGNCAGELSSPTCGSQLGNSPCPTDGCIGDCSAIGRIDLECEPATTWLLPGSGTDPTLVTNLNAALPDLLSVRDAESTPAIDEATRLVERLTATPASPANLLEQAQATLGLLSSARASTSLLIDVLGPARQGPMTGTGPLPDPSPTQPQVTCEPFQSPGGNGLIDDFEDGNSLLLPNDGRAGAWHIGQDGTGVLDQTEPPQPVAGGVDSNFALHLSGTGFTNWGANVTFELRAGSAPYDASVHSGLKFWARGSGELHVILSQRNLAPSHLCSTCLAVSGECGLFYSTNVSLSSQWSEIILDWSAFTAPAVILTPFGPDQLMTVQFESPAPAPVDFWLDNVAFY
ncbi:MAG: hypothetical protein RL033_2574 [Pseudomonadota bacterium]